MEGDGPQVTRGQAALDGRLSAQQESLAGAEDYFSASLATSLIGLSGVGGLTPVDMGKLLAGKLAGVSPSVGTYTHGMGGSTTPRDIETTLPADVAADVQKSWDAIK